MHHYDAGQRVESFISKAMYDQIRVANAQINSHRRSLDDIRSDIERRARTWAQQPQTPTANRNKPWWAFLALISALPL